MTVDDDFSPYPKSMIGRASRSFWHFVGNLTGSGTYKLIPLQQQVLDTLLPELEPEVRTLVEVQLTQPYYMQFWHEGRISPIYFKHFRLPRELRIPDPEFADRLYKVEMFVDGRKQQAHVVFVDGRIHRFEFKKPFKFYEGKDIRFGKVTLGKPKQTYTGALNRLEHGRDEELI